MKKFNLLWIIAILLIPYVFADTTHRLNDTQVIGDAAVNSGSLNQNFGATTTMSVSSFSGGRKRSYVRYNTSLGLVLPADCLVVSAVWSVNFETIQAARDVNIHEGNFSFGQGSLNNGNAAGQNYSTNITQNNQPCGPEATLDRVLCNTTAAATKSPTTGFNDFNITPIFNKHVNGLSNDSVSFVVTATGADADADLVMTSKEGATQANRHYLTISCGIAPVQSPPPDTTPPSITYYNLTSSDNGCENWNTDKKNSCITSSVTPTVQFNTSEDAFCAIAGSSSSTSLDKNYTDMGSSRNCTGAAAGEDSTNHLCTLTNQDELVYEASYLFISCKDRSNNSNLTSTSRALSINITNLDNTAKNSIELGIQNSLKIPYTIYTDQRVYARNSANSQSTGKFDKVVKRLNKIWAFNRIGVSDSRINMFNITPLLYTLEFANKTSAYTENQTSLLINATK